MDIPGYKWITGKKIDRPWGPEYRYTVETPDGQHINSIVLLPNKIDDIIIATLVIAQLAQIDVPPEPEVDLVEEKVSEIEAFLVIKGLLETGRSIWDIKSKDELIAEGVKL
jgi:hypothetical protein